MIRPFKDSGAKFSPCERYRYELWRQWAPGGTCLFIMLNPSTADAVKDDPTVAKCGRLARRWGYGRLEVRNIFAWRATFPQQMKMAADPVGPANNDAILSAALSAQFVVCAWGAHGDWMDRGRRVLAMLDEVGVTPHYLTRTKGGQPGHPLYVRETTEPWAWGF